MVRSRHAVVVHDQVDEDAEERHDDHEDDPEDLREAGRVVPAEQVREDRDQKPEPDDPGEDDEHRPEDVEKWVVSSNQHRTSCSPSTAYSPRRRERCRIRIAVSPRVKRRSRAIGRRKDGSVGGTGAAHRRVPTRQKPAGRSGRQNASRRSAVTLKHPSAASAKASELSIGPRFGLAGGAVPRHELPQGEMPPDVAYQVIHDELMLDGNARLNVATFVTHLDGAPGRAADRRVPRQEHDRQGRVPADGRDRVPLRRDPEPTSGTRPTREQATGCSTTGSSEAAMLGGLALKRRWQKRPCRRGQAGRQAQPRDGHQRPGLLGEVRELLGRRDAARAHGGRPLPPVGRGGREALRREHDRRRRRSSARRSTARTSR